jgi:hypothetical protein
MLPVSPGCHRYGEAFGLDALSVWSGGGVYVESPFGYSWFTLTAVPHGVGLSSVFESIPPCSTGSQ